MCSFHSTSNGKSRSAIFLPLILFRINLISVSPKLFSSSIRWNLNISNTHRFRVRNRERKHLYTCFLHLTSPTRGTIRKSCWPSRSIIHRQLLMEWAQSIVNHGQSAPSNYFLFFSMMLPLFPQARSKSQTYQKQAKKQNTILFQATKSHIFCTDTRIRLLCNFTKTINVI